MKVDRETFEQTRERGHLAASSYQSLMESWKPDHINVMGYWDFVGSMKSMSAMLRDMIETDLCLRASIYKNSNEFESGVEPLVGQLRNLLVRWISLTANPASKIETFKTDYGDVPGEAEFLTCCQLAMWTVATWSPPSRSLSRGIQADWELTQTEADVIDAIEATPAGSPGKLNFVPTPVPLGSASLIK